MNYHRSKNEKPEQHGKAQENTTESGYGEMIYMEPGINQMMSPITAGRQTQTNRSPDQKTRSIVSAVRKDIKDRPDIYQFPNDSSIPPIVVPGRNKENSPKTINVGDSKEQAEYNIRTLNARKSPKGAVYQTFTNLPENSPEGQIPYNNESSSYQVGNDSNIVITTMGGQFRQSPIYQNTSKEGIYVMGSQGRDTSMSKMSPNNVEEASPNERNSEKIKFADGNDMLNSKPTISRDNLMDPKDNMKYSSATYYNHMTMGDVKKIVKRFTQVYDPKKTKEGSLINEKQVILPGASDDVFNGRYRVLQKMNRLSNILLSNRKGYSQEGYDSQNSIDYNRKSFDRQTLNRSTLRNNRMSIRNRSRSPENKFLYISLAMISSKGLNSEDRKIYRRMRFEKGGVVDLAQEDRKKEKSKFKIRKAKQKAKGGDRVLNTNPKYREQAAKLIQAWWRELKELYKERLNMIIKIQSFWRGRWVRKYMYDILYLSFMYQSFCQIIQKVLVKHIRPYVLDVLFGDRKKSRNALKNILLKDEHWKMLRLKPYWDRWKELIKEAKRKSEKGRNLIYIRSDYDNKKMDLDNYFSKWVFLTKLQNLKYNSDNLKEEIEKQNGVENIVKGVDKFVKKKSLDIIKPKLKTHLVNLSKIDALKHLLNIPLKVKQKNLRKYFDRWRKKAFGKGVSDYKKKLFEKLLTNAINKINNNQKRKFFDRLNRKSVKKEIVEILIVKEKIITEEYSENKIGINKNLISVIDTLQRAMSRKFFNLILKSFKDNMKNKLFSKILNNFYLTKDNNLKNIKGKYIREWIKKTNSKDLKNKIIGELIKVFLTKKMNRILLNKLNNWRKKGIKTNEETYKQNKDFEKASNIIRKNSIKKIDGKTFFDNLKNTRGQKYFDNALKKILSIHFNKDEHLLRYYLNKWRDQCRKQKIQDLKLKLLKILILKYDLNNKKLLLSKAFNKWYSKQSTTLKIKKGKKNTGALLIKTIRNRFLKKNIKDILRRALKKWKEKSKLMMSNKNQRILEAKNHLLMHNKKINGPNLFKGAEVDEIKKRKRLSLSKAIETKNKIEKINLRKYLRKWKEIAKLMNDREKYLTNAFKVTKTNKDHQKNLSLLKALLKWRNNSKKGSNVPILLGLRHLLRGLILNIFKRLMKNTESVNLNVDRGKSIYDAILNGDTKVAKHIALRNLFLRPYFNRWKIINDNSNVKTTKDEFFKKLIQFPLKRISQFPLRKYLRRWRDKIKDIESNDGKKKIYLKILKNIRNKNDNDFLRDYLYRWRNQKNNEIQKVDNSGLLGKYLERYIKKYIFNKLKHNFKVSNNNSLFRIFFKRISNNNDRDKLRNAIRKWMRKLKKEDHQSKNYQVLRNLIKSKDRQRKNNNLTLLHNALLRWRINSVPLKKHDYQKVHDFRGGLIFLKRGIRRDLFKDLLKKLSKNKEKTSINNILNDIINKTIPNIFNFLLRRALRKWKSNLKDSKKNYKNFDKMFNKYLKKIRKKQFEDYKLIIDAINKMLENKNKKAQILHNFFKSLKHQKKIERTTNGANRLLSFLNKDGEKFSFNRLREFLSKWRRITKLYDVFENADIIKAFCRRKLNRINKENQEVSFNFDLLFKMVMQIIFSKFKYQNNMIKFAEIMLKLIKNNDKKRQKNLKDYLNKWKNIMPMMRKINAISKIQSRIRGIKGRKNYDNYQRKLYKLKYIMKKLMRFESTMILNYLAKWNMIAQQILLYENADIIKMFSKIKVNKTMRKIRKDDFNKFVKKIVYHLISDFIKKCAGINKKDGLIMIEKLQKIFMKKPFDQLLKYLKTNLLLRAIEKGLNLSNKSFKDKNLLKYFKKFYDKTAGYSNRKANIIKNFLKNKHKKVKNIKTTKSHDLLRKIMKNLINDNNEKLKIILRDWRQKAKMESLIKAASLIQRIFRGHKGRSSKNTKLSKNRIKFIFKKFFIDNIISVLKETNIKFYAPMKNGIKNMFSLTKRYATNNIIDHINNNLKKNYLNYLLGKINFSQNLYILQKYLYKWIEKDSKKREQIIKIQSAYRRRGSQIKRKSLEKKRDNILTLFLKHNLFDIEILRVNLRLWQLKSHLIKCVNNSERIKKFLLPKFLKQLRKKQNLFFNRLVKKILSKELKKIYKVNKLRLAIIKKVFPKFLKTTINYNRNNLIHRKLTNHIDKTEKIRKKNTLKRGLSDWNDKTKNLSKKEKKSIQDIQNKIRQFLARKKYKLMKKQRDTLKNKILKFSHESPLRIYFNKYKSIVKRLSLMDNADIIKKFCRILRKTITIKKNRSRMNTINDGLKILDNFKPGRKDAIKQIKYTRNRNLFNKVINDISNKRRNTLKDIFDRIFKYGKDKLNNIVFKIPDKLRLRILKKWLEIWREKARKLKILRSAEIIQKNWKIYKNKKRTGDINSHLKNILILKLNRHDNILHRAIHKWKNIINNIKIKTSAKRVAKYLHDRLKISKARINWFKLGNVIRKNNLISDIKKYGKIRNALRAIQNKLKRIGYDKFKNMLKYRHKMNKSKTVIKDSNIRNNLFKLSHIMKRWLEKADKLNKRDNACEKIADIFNTRNKINAVRLYNNVSLIKKLFHDIPYARAIDFFERLKQNLKSKKKFNKLGEIILQSKYDLDGKNLEIFIKKLHKVYGVKVINNMVDILNKFRIRKKIPHIEFFFKKLRRVFLKNAEFTYYNRLVGGNTAETTRIQFRANLQTTIAHTIKNDKENVYLTLTPYLVEWLKEKIKIRNSWSWDNFMRAYSKYKFCKLYKSHAKKTQIKNKVDLYDILVRKYRLSLYAGPGRKKLKNLLKNWAIHQIMTTLIGLGRYYRLLYMMKVSFMEKGIAKQRYMREIVRRWKFIYFSRIMAKKKMELMYKNLHLSYIQMANDVFGDDDNNNASVIKEFERFGNEVGAWSNENINKTEESKYSSIIQRKFVYGKENGRKNDYINSENYNTPNKRSYVKIQKKESEKREINTKNSEEIDFNKDNFKSSSYRRNKQKDELLKSPYNSSINDSESENYKPGTYKGRKK